MRIFACDMLSIILHLVSIWLVECFPSLRNNIWCYPTSRVFLYIVFTIVYRFWILSCQRFYFICRLYYIRPRTTTQVLSKDIYPPSRILVSLRGFSHHIRESRYATWPNEENKDIKP